MKDVYLFTNWYPNGIFSENFLTQEIPVASGCCNLTIVPMMPSKTSRDIPANVKVDNSIAKMSMLKKADVFVRTLYCKRLWQTLFCEQRKISLFKFVFYSLKYTFGANIILQYFKENINTIRPNSVLYSYWLSYMALGLAEAKHKYKCLNQCTVIARGHGYDVFEEERGIFIPRREFTLSELDAVYSVSSTGSKFLQNRYPVYATHIKKSYLGIRPMKSVNRIKSETIRFISCSSVYPVKRVELIYESICKYAIAHKSKNFEWTHIGKGLTIELLNQICKMPKNFHVDLKGMMSNADIYNLYETQTFDVFVNLSLAEGLPVSIMESLNAGIPVIATDVGGTKEIVNDQTGVLIPVDFKDSVFFSAVDKILVNHEDLLHTCKNYYEDHFVASKNYCQFYNEILNIKA